LVLELPALMASSVAVALASRVSGGAEAVQQLTHGARAEDRGGYAASVGDPARSDRASVTSSGSAIETTASTLAQ